MVSPLLELPLPIVVAHRQEVVLEEASRLMELRMR